MKFLWAILIAAFVSGLSAQAQVVWDSSSSAEETLEPAPDALKHGIIFADSVPIALRRKLVDGLRELVETTESDERLSIFLGHDAQEGYSGLEMVADWVVSANPVVTVDCPRLGQLYFDPVARIRSHKELQYYREPSNTNPAYSADCYPMSESEYAAGQVIGYLQTRLEADYVMLTGSHAVSGNPYWQHGTSYGVPVIFVNPKAVIGTLREAILLTSLLPHELHHIFYRDYHERCPPLRDRVTFFNSDHDTNQFACDMGSSGASTLDLLIASSLQKGLSCEGRGALSLPEEIDDFASLGARTLVFREEPVSFEYDKVLTDGTKERHRFTLGDRNGETVQDTQYHKTELGVEADIRIVECVAEKKKSGVEGGSQNKEFMLNLLNMKKREYATLKKLYEAGDLPGWSVERGQKSVPFVRGAARAWLDAIDRGSHIYYNVSLAHVFPCSEFKAGCQIQ